MTARPFVFATVLLLVPTLALAQSKKKKKEPAASTASASSTSTSKAAPSSSTADEELDAAPKEAPPSAQTNAAGEKKDTTAATAPTEAPGQTDTFKIKRGFFASSDLGLYMTFGGRNTNAQDVPARGTSNIQPHLGVTIGYDIFNTPSFDFAFGLRFAMGLNGGAGRVTEGEIAAGEEVTTKSNDFSVIEMGGEVVLGFLMTDRIALDVKLDGGMGIVDPDPSKTAGEEGAGSAVFAPTFGTGLGVEYFTLLNDFSVGLTLRFQAVLIDGLIPGATITVPIKYTF